MTGIFLSMAKPAGRSIVDELKQTRPFASKAQEATVALLHTTDVVRRRLARVVASHGITLQQYNVLRILRGAGGEPMSALDIAERLIEETPGISRLLDRLVAKKLIQRERCSEDRRRLECSITAKGLELLARLDEPVLAADSAAMDGLTAREVATLSDILTRIRQRNQ
jgi:MarR family transcriptional regulator, organic hydroperoxide resistance regulator